MSTKHRQESTPAWPTDETVVIPPVEHRDSNITPLAPPADLDTTMPATRSRESKRHGRRRTAIAATVLAAVAGGGLWAATHGGNSAEPGAKEAGISKIDVDALRQTDRPALPAGALEGINEHQWGDILNTTIVGDWQWYLSTLVHNPEVMDQIPTDDFTDTPNSEIITALKDMAQQMIEDNPDAVDILPTVCPTSTQSTEASDFGCSGYSSFVSDPENYPDISSIRVEYVAQDKNSNFSEHKELLKILEQPYKLVQTPDGTFKLNEN